MKYYSEIVQSVTELAGKNNEYIKEQIGNLKQFSRQVNLLKTGVSKNIERITDKQDHFKLFDSYILIIGNSDEQIKTFKKFFNLIDFISEIYDQLRNMQKIYVEDFHKYLIRYKNISEEKILNKAALTAFNIQVEKLENAKEDQLYNILNHRIKFYYEYRSTTPTVDDLQQMLVEPLKKELLDLTYNSADIHIILDSCRDATWVYNDLKQKSLKSAEELEIIVKDLDDTVIELLDLNRILIENINTKYNDLSS